MPRSFRMPIIGIMLVVLAALVGSLMDADAQITKLGSYCPVNSDDTTNAADKTVSASFYTFHPYDSTITDTTVTKGAVGGVDDLWHSYGLVSIDSVTIELAGSSESVGRAGATNGADSLNTWLGCTSIDSIVCPHDTVFTKGAAGATDAVTNGWLRSVTSVVIDTTRAGTSTRGATAGADALQWTCCTSADSVTQAITDEDVTKGMEDSLDVIFADGTHSFANIDCDYQLVDTITKGLAGLPDQLNVTFATGIDSILVSGTAVADTGYTLATLTSIGWWPDGDEPAPGVTMYVYLDVDTTFVETTDWVERNTGISWAPAGIEPEEGQIYNADYVRIYDSGDYSIASTGDSISWAGADYQPASASTYTVYEVFDKTFVEGTHFNTILAGIDWLDDMQPHAGFVYTANMTVLAKSDSYWLGTNHLVNWGPLDAGDFEPNVGDTYIVYVDYDTMYAATTDYTMGVDDINWSPSGLEPPVGAEYEVDMVVRKLTVRTPGAWSSSIVILDPNAAASATIKWYWNSGLKRTKQVWPGGSIYDMFTCDSIVVTKASKTDTVQIGGQY